MNCESKGVGHSYGSRHTELVITLTDSDGEPVNSNQEELNSDYGGQAGDLWLHKNGEWVAGILASQDAVMQKKTVSKVKFIDGRKVKMTGQNNQKKLFRIQENRVQRDDARGALLPLATTMFTHRIRTGRPVLYLDPLHSLSAEPEFQDYCIDMDKQLYSMLEADLQRVKDFEYFRSEHNVLTVDKIIPHLRANQHEVHQVDKEERAIDFMACDIASAVSYPHRRAQSRGVQQAVLTQANEDQVSKNVMGAKLGAIILGREISIPQKLLVDYGMPRVVQGGRGQDPKKRAREKPKETRGRPAGSTGSKTKPDKAPESSRTSRRVKNSTANAKKLAAAGEAMPGAQAVGADKVAPDLGLPAPGHKNTHMSPGYASDSTLASLGSDLSSVSTTLQALSLVVDEFPSKLTEGIKAGMEPMVHKILELEQRNAELIAKLAAAEANAQSFEKECGKWEDQLKSANEALHKAVAAAMSK